MKGIEPPTPSLPWKCSTPELHWQNKPLIGKELSGRRDSNSRPSAWKADALPTELLPPLMITSYISNPLMVGVIGFEPIQSETTDLQSAPALQLRRTPIFLIFEPVEGFEPPTR
jgi:hypothetical protein